MDKQHWKVERQPAWLVAAIKRTIAEMPGGYAEAAEWLGLYRSGKVSTDALYNRLRSEGDQIFPLEWAMVLQDASGTKYVTDAIARRSGGVFVPLVDIDDVDNGDINQRMLEAIEQITKYSQQVRLAIEDGIVEPHERLAINDELYLAISKLQEHATLVYRIFCAPEKSDARECAAPGALANNSSCMEK